MSSIILLVIAVCFFLSIHFRFPVKILIFLTPLRLRILRSHHLHYFLMPSLWWYLLLAPPHLHPQPPLHWATLGLCSPWLRFLQTLSRQHHSHSKSPSVQCWLPIFQLLLLRHWAWPCVLHQPLHHSRFQLHLRHPTRCPLLSLTIYKTLPCWILAALKSE